MVISTNILDLSLAVGVDAEWLVLLLDASVKGLAVLALAGVVTLLMRKVSAAERQLVWVAALAGLLVLPVVSVALPGWQVLPSWRQAAPPAALGPGPRAAVSQLPQPQPPPALETHEAPAPGHTSAAPVIHDAPSAAMPVQPRETPAAAAVPAAVPPAGAIEAWVLAIWALGAAVCLAPMVLGRLSLWRLRRGARPLTDGPWPALLRQTSEQLALGGRVALLQSDRCTMPMVWGVLRVRLLLPGEAANWSAERRRIVLLHELAHVKRWDCLVKIVTQLACAVYWFNPLVWLAAKRIGSEGERACDDLVLGAGSRPSDYAEHLVEISSGLQAGRLAVHSSIAMVRPAKLEGRVRAILSPTRIRRAIRRRAILIAAVLAIGITIPLACMQSEETANENPAVFVGTWWGSAASDGAWGSAHRLEIEILGPAEPGGALHGVARGFYVGDNDQEVQDVTVSDGTLTFRMNTREGTVDVRLRKDPEDDRKLIGQALPVEVPGQEGAIPRDIELTLAQPRQIRGQVLDHEGLPVAGAEIYLGGKDWLYLTERPEEPQYADEPQAETDQTGHFVVADPDTGEDCVFVSSPSLFVWRAPLPEGRDEMTIRLPQPGTVILRYDIPGGDPQTEFRMQLAAWDMEGWASNIEIVQNPLATNGDEVILTNVTPGTYDLARWTPILWAADIGSRWLLDRQWIEVRAGETTRVDFIRRTGTTITGEVVGLAELDLSGALVYVESAGPTPESDPTEPTICAALACERDGRFETERIEPGEYVVLARAYHLGASRDVGWRMPDFVGRATVTVPAEGAPPHVRIELAPFVILEERARLTDLSIGMTTAQVEERLGEPEFVSHTTSGAPARDATEEDIERFRAETLTEEWDYADGLRVGFNEHGHVIEITQDPASEVAQNRQADVSGAIDELRQAYITNGIEGFQAELGALRARQDALAGDPAYDTVSMVLGLGDTSITVTEHELAVALRALAEHIEQHPGESAEQWMALRDKLFSYAFGNGEVDDDSVPAQLVKLYMMVAHWDGSMERFLDSRGALRRPPTPPSDTDAATAPLVRVTCTGELIEYEARHQWCEWNFEGTGPLQAQFIAPKAVFRISSPAEYAGRTVGVIFRGLPVDSPAPLLSSDVGTAFSFTIPEEFFTGEYETTYNTVIRGLQAAPSLPATAAGAR